MKKKRYQKWVFTFGSIGALFGITIGQAIRGDINISGILGALTAVVIVFLINLQYVRSKKDKTPEVDERTLNNVRKYYAIIANLFLGFLFLLVAAVTYMGYEQISIFYLWIFIVSYMIISGIGALIFSRR